MYFKGKKLLIIGANAETIPIVKEAQKMGVVTYVTDHIPGSAAKGIADGFYDINGLDTEKIIEVYKKDCFDGILLGVATPLVASYVQICMKLNLPCMVDKNSVSFCTNKTLFKKECEMAGIRTVKEFFSTTDIDSVNLKDIVFPIIVKPAVSRGGRGINVCRSNQEFKGLFINAQSISDNSEVIGEEYIDADDCVATFLVLDGTTSLIALSDRTLLKNKEGVASVTYSNQFPSKYTEEFEAVELKQFKRLFEKLKIKNGIINIQMFKTEMGYIPYDPDCIINGECSSRLMSEIYGIDMIGGWIEYALTGEKNILFQGLKNMSIKGGVGASVWINLKEGQIHKVVGKNEIDKIPQLVDSLWRLTEGMSVTAEMVGREQSTLARFWVKEKEKNALNDVIEMIKCNLRVYDKFERNMIL